ncbi:MAG: hypothetical protein ACO3A4_12585 [Silvanigrellaceae bacterium]
MDKRIMDPRKSQRPPRSHIMRTVAKAREAAKDARNAHRKRIKKQLGNESSRRRRRTLFFIGAALIIILLSMRCSCSQPSVLPPAPSVLKSPTAKLEPAAKPFEKKAVEGRIRGVRRDAFAAGDANKPTWFETFRRQVLARSPRLAECFKGASVPGGVRWTVRFNTQTGEVSDHALEFVGAEGSLPAIQQSCLVEVLSQPGYAPLDPREWGGKGNIPKQAVPVSLVIEF